MATLHVAFGRAVRALRAQAGYSQESFADRIHIHRTSIGILERGEGNPMLHTIATIAGELGVSLSQLFLAVEEAEPTQS
jgi:transcriptional regulator with XRE-family HTH domain